ncbi:ABC transporter permease [Cohnella nanjingensis]|uniref:ABC transporter permease n=1 Tax=Cohnella nanjingensis TaxID=1387779 RepID=A0A7X0VHJ8_9BACL|nr:ABC transporter permease [Cohnella nanjingensis]MBB6674227.1 ABC transporter permease [Cohnella nanjingensis]
MSAWMAKLRERAAISPFRSAAAPGSERDSAPGRRPPSPFWIMVQKEFGDHIRSWRFMILLGIVTLACIGSIYASVTALKNGAGASGASGQADAASSFLFLKMFTESDGSLPNFLTFLSFLAPLIGIAIGFDAVNSERNKGTLSRVISQPVHRDDFLNAKFVAGLLLIAVVVFSLGFLVMGMGLLTIGYPPSPEEFWRVVVALIVTTVYVGLWLNLSLLFSVRFRQAATSALSGIAIWIFFLVFYGMIVNLVGNVTAPSDPSDALAVMHQQDWLMLLQRLSPAYLFQEAASTLLLPDVRTLNPFVTQDQAYLALNAPLPFGQSLLLVWPQVVAIVAETALSFAASYVAFMRQEIRSRS